MDKFLLQNICFCGTLFSGFLLLMAVITKITNGLFFSRMPQEFIRDQSDPRFDVEGKAGQLFSRVILKYVPPFFIAFLLGFIWTTLLT